MTFQLRWILLLGVVGFCISLLRSAGEKSLWSIQQTLSAKRYVALAHAFEPGIPRWPGFPDEMRKTIYWYVIRPDTVGACVFSEILRHAGQWGTRVDPGA